MWQKMLQSVNGSDKYYIEYAKKDATNKRAYFDRKDKPLFACFYQQMSGGTAVSIYDKEEIGEDVYRLQKGTSLALQKTLPSSTTDNDSIAYNETDGMYYYHSNSTYFPNGFAVWEN